MLSVLWAVMLLMHQQQWNSQDHETAAYVKWRLFNCFRFPCILNTNLQSHCFVRTCNRSAQEEKAVTFSSWSPGSAFS